MSLCLTRLTSACFSVIVLTLLCVSGASASAADWPMYRADAARSGYTAEPLPSRLTVRWTYRSPHPPMPAWPTRNRQRFDRAYQPVIAGGTLYFGSSADGKVYALDAQSGRQRWAFFTDGPARLAPAVWRGFVFVTSDDGHLYCLDCSTGKLVWKLRGGPRNDMLLGNDRLISRWPARGGPVVVNGTVYFAAGMWPSEGCFLYAVDAASGKTLWCNDSSGTIEMDQPHSSARAKSGVAAQGHLAVSGDALLVPTGRAVPAVFERSTGKLRYFRLQQNQHLGGSSVVAIDSFFLNGGAVFETNSGVTLGTVGLQGTAHPEFVFCSGENTLIALDRRKLSVDKQVTDRRGGKKTVKVPAPPVWTSEVSFDAKPESSPREDTKTPDNVMNSTAWTRPHFHGTARAMIVANDKIVIGGRGKVSMVDVGTRAVVWTAEVRGAADGLAAAGGRLYVSTDRGIIYCFDHDGPANTATTQPAVRQPSRESDSVYAKAAEEIIRRTGITEGYCLDLACGDGRLAIELARRTKLQIYATDADSISVRKARRLLDEMGLYGVRVMVHSDAPAKAPYPNHFADLVVSGRSVVAGPGVLPKSSWDRMLCPDRGIACLGRPGDMRLSVREALEGAGEWTHQNGNPANTLCSGDAVVRAPLEMLWFRDTDFVMPNRHGRGPGPLVSQGVMYVEGLNGIRAQNIYNGRVLWEYPLPGVLGSYHREHSIGAAWTGGNYCVSDGRVYVHDGERCFCLDAKTGEKVAELRPPRLPDGKPGRWGYIACDDGVLFGSLVNEDYLVKCWSDRWDTSGQFTESVLLFALNVHTGELKWAFKPERSIRHNAVALGSGRVYVIDRSPAPFDDIRLSEKKARMEARRRSSASGNSEREEFRRLTQHPPGRLLALDRQTGDVLWNAKEDAFGTLLLHSAEHDVVLMAYQAVHQASRDSERGDRLAAFRAADGVRLWEVQADYKDRPVLCNQTVYAPPGAWDLLTGKRLPFALDRSYGCGIVVGSDRLLVFRSATLGYLDLKGNCPVENYGGIRPGCWIPAVPAGGLLLMPDAASWCTCSYLNQATIALQPRLSGKKRGGR